MERRPMSIDPKALWQKRFGEHLSESIYYLRLVSSSGGLFAVITLFILALLYYEDFLALIPEQTPLVLLYALILAGVIVRVKFRTLLKEADLLFLTPIEGKMSQYFQRAIRYNYAVQGFQVCVILVVLLPIYTHNISVEQHALIWYFLIPLLLKGWNLQAAWTALRVPDRKQVWRHTLGRFLITFVLLYHFFSAGEWRNFAVWIIVLPMLAIGFIWLYLQERRWQQKHLLDWLLLIEMEHNLKNKFYQFVNAFTDVPQLGGKVRKRAWLGFVTAWIPFQSKQSYLYLYVKTFIRANEYLGLYIRLSILGLSVVYFLPEAYSKGIAYLLCLWMTSIQLKAMWAHHARQFWLSLYPLPQQLQQRSFAWLLTLLLGLQAMLMVILPLFQLGLSVVTAGLLLLGLAFAYAYPQLYLKRKLASLQS